MQSPVRHWPSAMALPLLAGLALLPLAGCANPTAEGAASCADVVEVAGHGYQDSGKVLTHLPKVATRTLSVTSATCADGNSRSWEGTRVGTSLPGVDPGQAFWMDGSIYTRQDQVGTVLGLPALTAPLPCKASTSARVVDGTLLWAAGTAVLRTTDGQLRPARDAWVQLPVADGGPAVEEARSAGLPASARVTCTDGQWTATSPVAR